jgi:hypothetical protein
LLQKRKKEALLFVAVAGLAVVGYFIHFKLVGIGDNTPNIPTLLRNPHIPIMAFFRFCGNNLWLPSLKIIALLWGVFIFFTYLLAIYLRAYTKNTAWFTFFTFMLLTAAMVSFNRSVEEMAPLRYRIYGSMLSISVLMFYFENKDALRISRLFKWVVPPIMIFSIFCSMLYATKKGKDTEFARVSTFNWQHDKSGLHSTPGKEIIVLQNIEEAGIYTMPKLPLSELAAKTEHTVPSQWMNRNSDIAYHIDYIERTGGYLLIKGWAYTQKASMDFTDIFIYLLGENDTVKLRPLFERRYDIAANQTTRENCGFFAVIPQSEIPQGVYTLGIEIQKRYIVPIKKSTQSIATDVQITKDL